MSKICKPWRCSIIPINNRRGSAKKHTQIMGCAISGYKTFANILQIRTVSAEYLVAMKLMAGHQYKNDLSDIVGVLIE